MISQKLRDVLEAGTKLQQRKRLRQYANAYEKMRSTLCILHTWCKHDAQRTTHAQIVNLIDATLDDVKEIE